MLVAGKTKWKGRSVTIDAQDELWTPPEEGIFEFEIQVIADDKHAKQVRCHCIGVLISRDIYGPVSS